jgi:predicted HicB family RNase H-like nuclease
LWKVISPDRAPEHGGAKMKIQISLNVPPSMHEAVTQRAERELISLSAYIRRALAAQLQRDGIEFEQSAPRLRT